MPFVTQTNNTHYFEIQKFKQPIQVLFNLNMNYLQKEVNKIYPQNCKSEQALFRKNDFSKNYDLSLQK